MIRPGAARLLGRALRKANPAFRSSLPPFTQTPPRCLRPSNLALTAYKPFTTSLQRFQTGSAIGIKHEKEVGRQPLEAHPNEVSTVSSVHQTFEEKGEEEVEDKGEDMLAGVKADLVRILGLFSGRCSNWDADPRFRKQSERHSPSTKYLERRFISA